MKTLTELRSDLATLEKHFRLAVEEGNFMMAAKLRDRMSTIRQEITYTKPTPSFNKSR